MKKLNETEILSLLSKEFESVYDYVYSYGQNNSALGRMEVVEDVGGEEGDGERRYIVMHFADHELYLRTDGFYASHYGEDWENGFGEFVKPTQKMITVYE